MAFSKAMMPHRSTLDRATALYLLETAIGRPMEIQFVNQTISLSDDDLNVLSDEGIFPLGVGRGRTYRDRGFGSETAVIVHELRSACKLSTENAVLDNVIAMMDADNRNGKFRRQPYSVCWIMRQGYRLGHDPSETGYTFTDEEVVRRGMHVVAVYLEANQHNRHINLGMREQMMRTPTMQLLPEGGPRNHQGPMTVSRYIRDMFMLGLPEDDISQRVKWFVRVHDRAKERQAAAKNLVEAGGFDIFELSSYREVGTWVDSDDPYLLENLAKNRPLVVMRRSNGNVIIMSTKFDLSGTASALMNREQCWYYQASPQILANGTEGIEEAPTAFYRQVIERDINRTVFYKV